MKLVGFLIALAGGVLLGWHLSRVFLGTDVPQGYFTHHVMSLVGGVLMFVGIWLYSIGRNRRRS